MHGVNDGGNALRFEYRDVWETRIVYYLVDSNQFVDALPGGYDGNFKRPFIPSVNYYGDTIMHNGTFLGYVSNTCYDSDGNPYSCSSNALVDMVSGQKVSDPDGVLMYDQDRVLYGFGIYDTGTKFNQAPAANEGVSYGQLINNTMPWYQDISLTFSMKFTRLDVDYITSGMSFRVQDYKNMYRLESSKGWLRLVKIQNGRKTVLKEINHAAPEQIWMGYKIKAVGSNIKIYEDGALVINVSDGTFAGGRFGPYATVGMTGFKGITLQDYPANSTYTINGVAIVDSPVTYETTYWDPENDPAYTPGTQWHYDHTDPNKFLDVGDGKSGLSSVNGQTVNGPILSFDKVGLYTIKYRPPDDPNPNHRLANGDTSFQGYSQYSEWYSRSLIVHRRPIVQYTVAQAADETVQWSDSSYDPDHCYNAGSCQNGYQTNHGIYYEKYYYITPSGNTVIGKLVHPTESGTYTVGKAVGDEYRAWSDYLEQTIQISCSACTPGNPPAAVLTFPNGDFNNPSQVSLQPTITWNQSDPDAGTVYSTFDLEIRDASGNCYECIYNRVMNTTNNAWSWTMDTPLLYGEKYQVRVRVSDGEYLSPWSNIGWMRTNSPPATYMTNPSGTQADPTMVNTLRPTLTWNQSDPDPGTVFQYFQIQITNEANDTMILDSGKRWQGTTASGGGWLVTQDLPAGPKLRVRVKVWDQYGAESEWSPVTWMRINRAPKADFTWTPDPAYEGDEVTLHNTSTDPDGDALQARWKVSGPAYEAEASSTDTLIPSSATDGHPGDYTVTLTVTDPYGASDTVTKIVRVGDLSVTGEVKHTARWEENRKAYNISRGGDAESPRPADTFWAGETFVLEAKTNRPAAQVEADMSSTDMRAQLQKDATATFWQGSMYRDDFERLPDGDYLFKFTAHWPNGHVETAVCRVKIKMSWLDYTASVRKQ
ncbi:PKD domain-containing protein [Paenibacillus sp. P26]|nr:PKD domain-containing protein [Paenibacillus sp. P26]